MSSFCHVVISSKRILNSKAREVNKDIQIPSKHNRFITLYNFRATCFNSLESSSGPLTNRPKTILIPSALWDPVALTIGVVIVL